MRWVSGEQQLKCTDITLHLSIAHEPNEVKSQLGALGTSITQWKAGVAPVTIRDIDTRMEKLRDEITACM
ncbi:hypothetical protein F442_04545 [Phytophthora nicotianae P10297]|uniref:Uncharacterized protein n=1 Tax=Phytophthora nicotianae P10297 TaxID=1317064 RepID=W2ZUY7_PHYNI|nr:hypothetical protein F442_04545 [Phytophthora nicotianae P10297]